MGVLVMARCLSKNTWGKGIELCLFKREQVTYAQGQTETRFLPTS
jgi:hypothetical protein